MEKPPEVKASPYELPEGLGFELGDKVRPKKEFAPHYTQTEYTIMGVSNLKDSPGEIFIRIRAKGDNEDVEKDTFKKEFEHAPEHVLEDLVD